VHVQYIVILYKIDGIQRCACHDLDRGWIDESNDFVTYAQALTDVSELFRDDAIEWRAARSETT
jgi:hypothetical protein